MMSTASLSDKRAGVGRPRGLRLLAIPATVVAVVIVWLLAVKAVGIDLHQPAFGSATPKALSVGFVVVVGVIAALLGWGLIAALERLRRHSQRLWLPLSSLLLLASLGLPLSGHGVSAGNRFALICMHLAAGLVLIPTLYLSGRGSDKRFQ